MLGLSLCTDRPIQMPIRETLIFRGKSVNIPRNVVTPFLKAHARNRFCAGDALEDGIGIAAYWDSADGYGQSTNFYVKEMLTRGINVIPYWHPMNPYNTIEKSAYPEIRKLKDKKVQYQPKVSLALTIPEDIYIVPPSPCLIAMSMWETDRLPEGRAHMFDPFDLVLTPSEFCRQAFIASGCRNEVKVCPLPLNPLYAPRGRWKTPENGQPYRFLFISTPIYRKGIETLVEGFQRAFPRSEYNRKQVRLHLHTRRWSAAPSLIEAKVQELVEADSRITHTTARLSDKELLKLYDKHHCMVHAAKGEGMGLSVAQAMSLGVPVIAPAQTGMADFVNHETAGVIDIEGWEVPVGDGFYHRSTEGEWVVPSVESCAEQMRSAYEKRDFFVTRAEKASPEVWGRYNPQAATQSLLDLIEYAWRKCVRRSKKQYREMKAKLN